MDFLANNPLTRIPKSCSSQVIQRPRPWLGKTFHFSHSKHNDRTNYIFLRKRRRIRAGLEEIIHNQVLVSATVAGLGSQLLKPFVPAVLGRGFNWELALTSGGMPSSHSSSVVAAATAIGLERGFADSLFGLSVVIAGIIMNIEFIWRRNDQFDLLSSPPRKVDQMVDRRDLFPPEAAAEITQKNHRKRCLGDLGHQNKENKKTNLKQSSTPRETYQMMYRREISPPCAVSMQKNRYKQRFLGDSNLQNMENRETINQNTLNYSFKSP